MNKYLINAKILFDDLNVKALDRNAGIFFGKNVQSNWNTNLHNNTGFGVVTGNSNEITSNSTLVLNEPPSAN